MQTSYAEKLADPRWQKKRLEVMERDRWACLLCSDDAKTLHVHHTEYTKGMEPWDYPHERLVTLCQNCHASLHRCRQRPSFHWDTDAGTMVVGWTKLCPACGSDNQKDKGTFDKCMDCGARYGCHTFAIPSEDEIVRAIDAHTAIDWAALLTGNLRDTFGWSGQDMFRLYLCLSRMKDAGQDTSAGAVLLSLDPEKDCGGSVHGMDTSRIVSDEAASQEDDVPEKIITAIADRLGFGTAGLLKGIKMRQEKDGPCVLYVPHNRRLQGEMLLSGDRLEKIKKAAPEFFCVTGLQLRFCDQPTNDPISRQFSGQ